MAVQHRKASAARLDICRYGGDQVLARRRRVGCVIILRNCAAPAIPAPAT